MLTHLTSKVQKFKRTHVNIVDLVDAYGTTDSVDMFETVKALAKYSKKTKKIFPLDEAKDGGLLKFLLRKIL